MTARGTGVRLVPAVVLAVSLAGCAGSPGAEPDGIPLPDFERVEADIVAAVHEARAPVRQDPSDAKAWGQLGDRYWFHGWSAEAAECYRRAAELEPDWFAWTYRMGLGLSETTRREEALAAFEASLALNAFHAPAHERYAKLLAELGREDEAAEHYARASELDPTSSHAELGLGQLAAAAGDYERARVHLEEAARRHPRHGKVYQTLSQVYFALGDTERAQQAVERTRELPKNTDRIDLMIPDVSPRGASAHAERGHAYEQSGAIQQALVHYRRAVELNPGYQVGHYYLGAALARTGDFPEAARHLHRAVELNRSDFQSNVALGEVLLRLNRPAEALGYLAHASAMNPDDEDLRLRVESLRAALERGAS